MAYIPITSTEIQTGEPVSSSTQERIKENLANHEQRLISVENGSTTVYPPIVLRVNGTYTNCTYENMAKTTMNFNLVVTGVRLLIDGCGVSGTTEVTLKWKRGDGGWTSLLTSNPRVSYTAGNDAISNNAVLNSSNINLEAGDILRLDVVSAQKNGRGFLVRIDYNKT